MPDGKIILAFVVGLVVGILIATRPKEGEETLDERPGEDLGYIPEDLVH